MRAHAWCLFAAICLVPAAAQAQSEQDDHSIVFELGAAGDWTRAEPAHYGGTLAFEVTPIEHWLELEFGATTVFAAGSSETSFDALFKKPWQPSQAFEVMVGVGPEVVLGRDSPGMSWGVETVLDLMFWPKRNVGWYVEPGYDVVWRGGAPRHGVGVALGLLIGR